MKLIKKFLNEESGQGMVEYILIVVLVAIAAIVVVKAFGGKIATLFKKATDTITEQTDDAFPESKGGGGAGGSSE